MRLLISYITILSTVIFSCNSNSNQQYIANINSLSIQLEDAAKNYSTIDSIVIVGILENVKENCSIINSQNNNKADKIFISYSHIIRSMEQIFKLDSQIKKELVKSRIQINNLLYDTDNNLVDTVLLVRYIEDEKTTVKRIIDRMNSNYERIIAETNRYDSLNPLIENLTHQ